MISAARGTSAVMTRSPAAARLTISLSATSKPEDTCSTRRLGMRGIATARFATSVTVTPVRSAARKRISLITFGQASASTHMLAGTTFFLSTCAGWTSGLDGTGRRWTASEQVLFYIQSLELFCEDNAEHG